MIKTKCYRNIFEWHDWYAWYPVKIGEKLSDDKTRYCYKLVWREVIEQRLVCSWGDCMWEYRLKGENNGK